MHGHNLDLLLRCLLCEELKVQRSRRLGEEVPWALCDCRVAGGVDYTAGEVNDEL